MVCVDQDRFPHIELSPEEQRNYDDLSTALLRRTLQEYTAIGARPDPTRWSAVRRRGDMTVFKNIEPSTNKRVALFMGKGRLDGTVGDIMDGLYCDSTPDLRAVKALLNYKFIDGGIFQVSQTRSEDAPYRFAGIKWFAAKSPLGRLVADRDLLTYEVMGQVMDEFGHEFAFHSYQSIERPEWQADSIKGIKRAHTSTCYLYRTHSHNQVEVFFQGDFVARGYAWQPISDYTMAGKWLAVANSVRCAQAKRFVKLMESTSARHCYPSDVCDVCHARVKSRSAIVHCAGCLQNACKSCSFDRPVFKTSSRTGEPLTERFCVPCVKKVSSVARDPSKMAGVEGMQGRATVSTDTDVTRGSSVDAFLV